ncbi:MAG: type II toxin-antitoxin system RelE/ParE family toxin [Candidatus Poribacteria bacterium]|nr:type II toxin-antitoxin system RelE/ParE family toxin [Candidatus Poribacteria bacterium]
MNDEPILNVIFFHTDSGRAPVQQWLKNLDKTDRKTIGGDIQLVQFCWPLGMPLVKKTENSLWEVRSHISAGRIARVLFTIGDNEMVLLHAFIKKSQKISQKDLNLARHRRNLWHSGRNIHEQV